jgi:predicted metal-dependent phosphoesterase TrpH
MLKTELHTHTSADPHDYISYSTTDLIDRAAALGYDVLAITLHDRWFDVRDLTEYARGRGITLIAGMERTIEHKHVLLLNFDAAAERVSNFDDLAQLRRAQPAGLVIAPHPYYPARCCLGGLLERHADLFDAVELNAFYTSQVDRFNRMAIDWARRVGKPIVANADVHRLAQLGRTFSLVDAPPEPNAICEAIRAGRVEVQTRPLSLLEAATHLAALALGDVKKLYRKPARSVFVPTDAAAGRVADEGRAAGDLQRLGDDGVPPVRVLEPVRGRRTTEQLSADLGPEMTGHPYALRVRQSGSSHPAGHATDLHHVRHHVV